MKQNGVNYFAIVLEAEKKWHLLGQAGRFKLLKYHEQKRGKRRNPKSKGQLVNGHKVIVIEMVSNSRMKNSNLERHWRYVDWRRYPSLYVE